MRSTPIVAQRVEGVELIVIDGGSTDGSLEEIEKRRSGLTHFESGPNSGQSEAFNKGIARASGKYLMWVNADDVLVPGSLRRLVNTLRAHPTVDWFAGNSVFMDQSEHILWVAYAMRPIRYILKAGITYVGGPSTIFSRKLFDTFGPFDETLNYSMDTDLWKKFIRGGHVFRRLDFIVWAFRVHSGSKTSHTFSNEANPAYDQEQTRLANRHSSNQLRTAQRLYYLLRAISWSGLKSAAMTARYRGLPLASAFRS